MKGLFLSIIVWSILSGEMGAAQVRPLKPGKSPSGGYKIDPNRYPNVFEIFTTSNRCTATLIGPQVIITAAHCISTAVTSGYLMHNNKKYEFDFFSYENYRNEYKDLAMGILREAITDVKPATIPWNQNHSTKVIVLGFGCSDGKLGNYFLTPIKIQEDDVYLREYIGNQGERMTVCPGDSGGPMFAYGYDNQLKLVGVNILTNHKDKSWGLILQRSWVLEFFFETERKFNVQICGVHSDCI